MLFTVSNQISGILLIGTPVWVHKGMNDYFKLVFINT